MLPPAEQTIDEVSKLIIQAIIAEESADKENAIDEAPAGGKRFSITEQAVEAVLLELRRGAQPGASRIRNELIIAVAERPQGIKVLRDWVQIWADGEVRAELRRVFTTQVIRPLRKAAGTPDQ
jgi:hypothetical protein